MISSGAKFLRAYVRKIYIRKLTMYERWLVNVKVEPRSTSCINSSLFILPLFYLRDYHLRALSQKRVSGNQPLLSKFLYSKAWLHGYVAAQLGDTNL